MSQHITVRNLDVEFSQKALLAIGHTLGRTSAISLEMAKTWAIDQLERAVATTHPDISDDGIEAAPVADRQLEAILPVGHHRAEAARRAGIPLPPTVEHSDGDGCAIYDSDSYRVRTADGGDVDVDEVEVGDLYQDANAGDPPDKWWEVIGVGRDENSNLHIDFKPLP